MGGDSTSQGAVLNEKKTEASPAFDLHSWQGLTQVLKMGKDALKDTHAYSDFRNLVLQYAQQGGDAEVRKQIDAIIATFGASSAAPAPKIDSVPEQQAAPMKSAPTLGRRLPPKFVKPAEANPPVIPAAPQEAPIVSEPLPVPLAQSEQAAPPVKIEAEEAAPAVKAEKVDSSPAFKTLDEHKARIAEIKRLVNAKVGNPAMLIDSHNELGKQYMKALLTALKATGGGGEGVDAAMSDLETAFDSLMQSESSEATPEETVPKEERSGFSDPQPEETPAPDLLPHLPEERVAETEAPVREEPVSAIRHADEKIMSVMRDMQKQRESAPVMPLAREESVAAPHTTSVHANLPPETWQNNRHVIKGIGKRPIEEIKRDSGVDPSEVIIKQTELSSSEITETLHQLLDEWSIFKARGLFGTGPSGKEHPLYKTLAPLSMGEVIAGRWEGSDHKLTKVIKQYVDAWRHEQGIAYVITETFEHYLRRVVQRILRRQTQN